MLVVHRPAQVVQIVAALVKTRRGLRRADSPPMITGPSSRDQLVVGLAKGSSDTDVKRYRKV